MELTDKFREYIERVTGLSREILQRIADRHQSFYFQNRGKIEVGGSAHGLCFAVSDRRLRGKIYNVVGRDGKDNSPLSEAEMSRYFDSIDFRGARVSGSPRDVFMYTDVD